jgi:hypothetical protein
LHTPPPYHQSISSNPASFSVSSNPEIKTLNSGLHFPPKEKENAIDPVDVLAEDNIHINLDFEASVF